jgi:hypothetical protein
MNVLEYILRAKDESSAVLQGARSRIEGASKSIGAEFASLAARGASVVGIFYGIKRGIEHAFSEFAAFETLQAQFQTLLGSLDAAKQRMAEIQGFKSGAAGGLFGEDDIAKASMNLEKLTEGALAGQSAWQMIGDVAAGTGNTMESVSFAIGKAFGQLKEGLPIDRALMQLQQLGVIGPETIKILKDLEDSGGTLAQKWDVVAETMAKYNGGMENMQNTSAGALKAMKSAWDEWFQSIGEGIHGLFNGFNRITGILKVIGEGRLFDFKTWDPAGDNIEDWMKKRDAEIDAERAKEAEAKRVQDELAKRQAEIDKKLAEEKAHKERLLAYKLAGEAAEAEAKSTAQATREARAEAERTARQAEETRKKNLSYSWKDAAAALTDRFEGTKEKRLKTLDAAIEDLGKKAESAALKLQNANNWLAAWGGQAGGEFGARGPGRRDWVAGLADARAQNAQQGILDKKDQARWTELQGRIARRGTKLSPEDQQWMDDQRAWVKKQKENADAAKKAKADADQANADAKALEDEKKRIAEETRDACKAIRDNLDKTLRAI